MAYQRTSGVTFPSRARGTDGGRKNHDGSCPHAAGSAVTGDERFVPALSLVPPARTNGSSRFGDAAPVFHHCPWCSASDALGTSRLCLRHRRELLREAVTGLLVVALIAFSFGMTACSDPFVEVPVTAEFARRCHEAEVNFDMCSVKQMDRPVCSCFDALPEKTP